MSTEEVPTRLTAKDIQERVAEQRNKRIKSEMDSLEHQRELSEFHTSPKATVRKWIKEMLDESS